MENKSKIDPSQNESQFGLFEEYKLFFESAERVTDRRINLNRTNYTMCVAIISGIAIIVSWIAGKGREQYQIYAFTLILFISIASIILCIGWLRQIADLKTLNNAKFKIINLMASSLKMVNEQGKSMQSFRPFEKEWSLVEEANGTVKFSGFSVLKASRVEYFLPWSFIILFGIIGIFCIVRIMIFACNVL